MNLATTLPAAAASQDTPATPSALEVYTTVRSIAAENELWPGFDPRQVPVMLYDGQDTYLYGHPSLPAGFAAKPGTNGAYIFPGLHDQVRANTMIEFNGVWTATVMLPMLGGGTIEQAAICIHEMFHVYQKRNHESWFANEAELFMYPVAE